MEPHIYSVDLNWNAARSGELYAAELSDKIKVATPPPFEGGVAGVWSPEHLLTAAVCSCFMTTFLAIAANSKLEFIAFSCAAKGKLEQIEGKYLITQIELFPVVKLTKAEDSEKAERILAKSEKACLIANSIKSAVSLHTSITF